MTVVFTNEIVASTHTKWINMHKNTFITFDSQNNGANGLIAPRQTIDIYARTQIPIRPHRLRIEPELAAFFMIEDVRHGQRSLFPRSQRVPATQFSIGLGDGLDADDVYPDVDLMIRVTNTSHLVPGAPLGPCSAHRDPRCRLPICLQDYRRFGVPLPFRATWSAIVVPPRVSAATLVVSPDGREDLDTRIERVQETVGSPRMTRRELPGFGWDPYGTD